MCQRRSTSAARHQWLCLAHCIAIDGQRLLTKCLKTANRNSSGQPLCVRVLELKHVSQAIQLLSCVTLFVVELMSEIWCADGSGCMDTTLYLRTFRAIVTVESTHAESSVTQGFCHTQRLNSGFNLIRTPSPLTLVALSA